MPTPPTALTIAGSDSGGGAGIQADLKTFAAHGVFGMSVVTALTAQNTSAVMAVHETPLDVVRAQIDAVASDLPVGAVKTGMLGSVGVIREVADGLTRHGLGPVVVDPVMVTTTGHALIDDAAVGAVVERMFPLAALVTPNAHEAARLAGFAVETLDDARRAAAVLRALGAAAVLVKGGHLTGEPDAVDLLLDADGEMLLRMPRLDTDTTHGTGCTYASAIAAGLARGHTLRDAVARARRYVQGAIAHGLDIGAGNGPTNHVWFLDGEIQGEGVTSAGAEERRSRASG